MKNKNLTKVLLILILISTSLANVTNSFAGSNVNTAAKSYLTYDFGSQKVLNERNSDEALPIASLTKLLSIYVVFDQLKEKKLNLNDKVQIPSDLAAFSKEIEPVPVVANYDYSVEQLIEAALVESSNVSIMALGQKISGSQQKFVELMRDKAKQINLKNTEIINVSGLDNADIPEKYRLDIPKTEPQQNEMSAKDLSKLTLSLLKSYPEITKITQKDKANIGSATVSSTNKLLKKKNLESQNIQVDGLKTGTTLSAENCLITTGTKNGRRTVAIVLGVPLADKPQVFNVAQTLLTNSFIDYKEVPLFTKDQVVETVTNADALPHKEPIITKDNINILVPTTYQKSKISKKIKVNMDNLPINKNSNVGKISVQYDDNLGYVNSNPEYKLKSEKSIKKMNLWDRFVGLFTNDD